MNGPVFPVRIHLRLVHISDRLRQLLHFCAFGKHLHFRTTDYRVSTEAGVHRNQSKLNKLILRSILALLECRSICSSLMSGVLGRRRKRFAHTSINAVFRRKMSSSIFCFQHTYRILDGLNVHDFYY